MRFHSNHFTNGEIFKQYANLMIRDTPLKSIILRFKDYEIRHVCRFSLSVKHAIHCLSNVSALMRFDDVKIVSFNVILLVENLT